MKTLKMYLKKSVLLAIVCIWMPIQLSSQVFYGIQLNQHKNLVINALVSKGFVVNKTDGSYTSLKGKLVNEQVTVTVYHTITSKKVRKLLIIYSGTETWESSKTKYNSMVGVLESKYGPISEKYEYFSSPYYEGDGYELQAIENDNATLTSLWFDLPEHPNLGVSVEITNGGLITVLYEVISNITLHQQELEKLQQGVY